jgi:hypothetical protein
MENEPKKILTCEEIMLALTTTYSKDIDFLDDVNRVTFGLISRKTNHASTRSNYR